MLRHMRLRYPEHFLRASDDDPTRVVTFSPGIAHPVLYPEKRSGRPRQHWTIESLRHLWPRAREMFGVPYYDFEEGDIAQLERILEAAVLRL